MVQLIPDVYAVIISHLRRPLPSSNGRNARSSIAQNELTILMRVNKLFNNLTAPYLYTIVATDYLPLLIFNIENPASATGIRSKRSLLSLTRRLFVEYAPKTPPSYMTLMGSDAHSSTFFSLVDDGNAAGLKDFCWMETYLIADCADILKDFLKLSTLSLGAFLPSQTEIWEPMKDFPSAGQVLSKNQRSLAFAQENISGLAKTVKDRRPVICHRIAYGPLTCKVGIFEDGIKYSDPKHSVHIDSRLTYKTIPTVLGGKSAWFCPNSLFIGRGIDRAFIQGVGRIGTARELFRGRRQDTNKKGKDGTDDRDFLDVDLYVPSRVISDHTSAGSPIEHHIDKMMDSVYEDNGKKKPGNTKEEWKIKKIEEAPKCKACGWCFEDEDVHEVEKEDEGVEYEDEDEDENEDLD